MAATSARPPVEVRAAPLPRVLHIADADFFARFGRMFRQLAIGLSDEGFRVLLLTDDAEAAASLEATPAESRAVRRLFGWRGWRLRRELEDSYDPPPTLVHLWGTSGLRTAARWTADEEIPLLIHVSSEHDIERLRSRGLADHETIVAGCESLCQTCRRLWPLRATSVHVIRPGLVISEEVETEVGAASARSAADRTFGILWTGRIDESSGLEVLIDALARLRKQERDVQVVLIGDGPASPAFWRRARRQQVADCLSLIAEPGLWDRALRGADVFVVPTCQRELSLAPLLAMSLGKLVVAAREQLAEWFVEDQTVWPFAADNPDQLAQCLGRAADDKEAAAALAAGAAVYVRRHHTVSRLTSELATVYREVARLGEGPTIRVGAAGGSTQ